MSLATQLPIVAIVWVGAYGLVTARGAPPHVRAIAWATTLGWVSAGLVFSAAYHRRSRDLEALGRGDADPSQLARIELERSLERQATWSEPAAGIILAAAVVVLLVVTAKYRRRDQ